MPGFVVGCLLCMGGPCWSQAPGSQRLQPFLGGAWQHSPPSQSLRASACWCLLPLRGVCPWPCWQSHSYVLQQLWTDMVERCPGEAGAGSSWTYPLSEPQGQRTMPQPLGWGISAFVSVSTGVLVTFGHMDILASHSGSLWLVAHTSGCHHLSRTSGWLR